MNLYGVFILGVNIKYWFIILPSPKLSFIHIYISVHVLPWLRIVGQCLGWQRARALAGNHDAAVTRFTAHVL